MRFAMTATDRYIGIFDTLVEAGWQPIKLFSNIVDGRVHTNQVVQERAAQHNIEMQFSRMDERSLAALAADGCEALIVASYAWRIPSWENHLRYALNFHPSPLPFERGPNPGIRAILDGWSEWAVSCHKITPDWDAGDILDQESFPLMGDECRESLDLKIQLASRTLANRVATYLPALWHTARAQEAGSYSHDWTVDDRRLDFSQKVTDILRRVRAFGNIETTAKINDVAIYVRRAVGWPQMHAYPPGVLVHVSDQQMLVSARDGFIGILEWGLNDPLANIGNARR